MIRILAALAIATLAAAPAQPAIPPAADTLKVGQPAPNFTIRSLDGETIRLSDLKGKVVVINLWATWCAPCRVEMPALDLMQVNGGKHGLQIIGVLVRDPTPKSGLRKLNKVLNYPLAMRIEGKYEPVEGAVPTNYIIDRKGVLRYAKAASLTKEDFAELLVPLINEAP